MPNNSKHLEIKTNRLVNSLFVGNYKTAFKGRGLEFADFKEYEYGEDAKDIDWVVSSREDKILVRRYVEERELQIYFLVSATPGFGFGMGQKKKKDTLLEFLHIIGLSSMKSGDKLGMYAFNDEGKVFLSAKKWKTSLLQILQKLDTLSYAPSDLGKHLGYMTSLPIKDALVFLITDSLEIDSRALQILAMKHDVVVCHLFDSFENTLKGTGVEGFSGGDTVLFVDIGDEKKRQAYVALRTKKIADFRSLVHRYGASYLMLDETQSVYASLYQFMRERERW